MIACARYRIYDLRTRANEGQTTHVLFIIHLPHSVTSSSFVGFQGEPWTSSHIDDLRPTTGNTVSAYEAIGSSISELFLGHKEAIPIKMEDPMTMSFDSQNSQGTESIDDNGSVLSAKDPENTSGSSEEVVSKIHWAKRVRKESNEDMDTDEEMKLPRSREQMTIDDIESEDDGVKPCHPVVGSDEKEIDDNLDFPPSSANRLDIQKAKLILNNDMPFSVTQPERAGLNHEQPSRSPLYKRLHGCIQAAASRVKDFTTKRSTKRIEVLVRLIPKDPPCIPGTSYILKY